MDQSNVNVSSEALYPVLLIPKHCTTLETNYEVTDNVFIVLNVTSPDIEGNEMCIYKGYCNIKLIDNYVVNVQHVESPLQNHISIIENDVNEPGNQDSCLPYNPSQVWIDPLRSPHVYNSYNATATQEYSICHQTHSSSITVKKHNTYITQNLYNYKESVHSSPTVYLEDEKCKKAHPPENVPQQNTDQNNWNLYDEDEFQCGVFLSHLPEEILNEKEIKAREERKYIGLHSSNNALKQLMSSDMQSMSKQRKTILFLGHDSQCGQTIQKIAFNDPTLVCSVNEDIDHEVVIDDTAALNPHQKRYQCDKCKQIFDQISAFKQHVGTHRVSRRSLSWCDADSSTVSEIKFKCTECGKNLKNQKKFEQHCLGHGDPELECNKCHKVFASKFTLRAHRKIHNRKHMCNFCSKTYANIKDLRAHASKVHYSFMCDSCDYVTEDHADLLVHENNHHTKRESLTSLTNEEESDTDIIIPSPEGHCAEGASTYSKEDEIQRADSVIAKVMANKMFLLHSKKARKHNKVCEVCLKDFNRIGDLKRHLIEHIIRSTLAKTPVTKDGTLNIQCEVCQSKTFTKIHTYKAHLREHAKLTLYKCIFCDKSFSDSSNFSKHKKIHDTSPLQCDLCQRKFNSKKMITRHMEYHNQNSPIKCPYCQKLFYFESMLNKHVKYAHIKKMMFRCRFCHDYFKTLREKWDHEWTVHNVRKMIVDCLICGSKYRKYSELKRHCIEAHDMEIPKAKSLLKKRCK